MRESSCTMHRSSLPDRPMIIGLMCIFLTFMILADVFQVEILTSIAFRVDVTLFLGVLHILCRGVSLIGLIFTTLLLILLLLSSFCCPIYVLY